jgi:uncharacterized membrane protein YeiH
MLDELVEGLFDLSFSKARIRALARALYPVAVLLSLIAAGGVLRDALHNANRHMFWSTVYVVLAVLIPLAGVLGTRILLEACIAVQELNEKTKA